MRLDLTGRRFGIVVALECVGASEKGEHKLWKCRCDCGAVFVRRAGNVVNSGCVSCGCHRRRLSSERMKLANRRSGKITKTSAQGGGS